MRRLGDEDGSATIEFCLLFPAFMLIALNAIEAGVLMTRSIMLERSVDLAVRAVRLGTPAAPSFDEFKASVCDQVTLIPDCLGAIQVELTPVAAGAWGAIDPAIRCRDRASDIDPVTETTYVTGENNDVMLVRVCVVVDPIFPTSGMGAMLPKDETGGYALVTASAFVNEPSR